MAIREHEEAVRQAEWTGALLRTLFNRMGNADHPRGKILTEYRKARRALAGKTKDQRLVADVLTDLRTALAEIALELLQEAETQGERQAAVQLAIYGLPTVGLGGGAGVMQPHAAWMAQYDAQRAAVLGVVLAGGDEKQILGDDNRAGILTPGPVVSSGASWMAMAMAGAVMAGIAAGLSRSGAQPEYMRQAVAAIDERTTNCCLNVHGQVVGMEERFTLTGTPRYADEMRDPPFHKYCRTSVALVRAVDADDALSVSMRNAAEDELSARGPNDVRTPIHPASATSRR